MKENSKTDWERIERMDDSEIDYSDVPETDENFWKDARIVVFTIIDNIDKTIRNKNNQQLEEDEISDP